MSESSSGARLPQPTSLRLGVFYLLMLLAAVAAFLLICRSGERLTVDGTAVLPAPSPAVTLPRSELVASPAAVPAAEIAAEAGPALPHVLGALMAIILTGQLLGRLFRRLGQPRVIGEVVAGILLGPSFLGQLSPAAMQFVLPESIVPALETIAQLGIILYMFLVGLELNGELLRKRAQATLAVSHSSIVVPFVLGSALALYLYPRLAPAGVAFTSFSMFLGAAMAITAFPVLARILTDRGLQQSALGVIALGCAAADDVTAWCLLAFVVGVAQADLSQALTTAVLALAYVACMLIVVRRLIARWLVRPGGEQRLTYSASSWVLLSVLTSALITDAIGIHAIFGAFLLGAVIPHDSLLARQFRTRLEDVVTILLLPAFFACTGLRTQIGLVSSAEHWLMTLAIILTATLGKFGGSLVAARLTGLDWRMSASLGILMNTRGLMELIVLNIGLDLGIISPTLFAMMVLMALVTTMATTPILDRLQAGQLATLPEPAPGDSPLHKMAAT